MPSNLASFINVPQVKKGCGALIYIPLILLVENVFNLYLTIFYSFSFLRHHLETKKHQINFYLVYCFPYKTVRISFACTVCVSFSSILFTLDIAFAYACFQEKPK